MFFEFKRHVILPRHISCSCLCVILSSHYVSFYWWGKVENHTFSSLILLYLSSLLTEVGHFYQIYSKILARKLTFVQIRSRQYLTGLWFCCSSSFCLKVLLKVCSVLVLLGTMTPAWSSRENFREAGMTETDLSGLSRSQMQTWWHCFLPEANVYR